MYMKTIVYVFLSKYFYHNIVSHITIPLISAAHITKFQA